MLMCTEEFGEDRSAVIQSPRLAATTYTARNALPSCSKFALCIRITDVHFNRSFQLVTGLIRVDCHEYLCTNLMQVVPANIKLHLRQTW